eukprot:scaffold3721_cov134-Isochrysis_galbana.AAC.1
MAAPSLHARSINGMRTERRMYAATAPAPEAAERLDDATDILLGETGRAPGDAGVDTGCRSRGGSGGARPAELALERGGIRADSTGATKRQRLCSAVGQALHVASALSPTTIFGEKRAVKEIGVTLPPGRAHGWPPQPFSVAGRRLRSGCRCASGGNEATLPPGCSLGGWQAEGSAAVRQLASVLKSTDIFAQQRQVYSCGKAVAVGAGRFASQAKCTETRRLALQLNVSCCPGSQVHDVLAEDVEGWPVKRLGEDVGHHLTSGHEVRLDHIARVEVLDEHHGPLVVTSACGTAWLNDGIACCLWLSPIIAVAPVTGVLSSSRTARTATTALAALLPTAVSASAELSATSLSLDAFQVSAPPTYVHHGVTTPRVRCLSNRRLYTK